MATWSDKKLELECAEAHLDASTTYFQKTVTSMRDAAAEVSRAVTRLTAARKAMLRVKAKVKRRVSRP